MGDNTQETAVKITGDSSGAVDAMKQASGAVQEGVGKMKGALSEVGESFKKLTGVFVGLAAAVAGGAFFSKAIDATNKMTGETIRLQKSLGITAEAATTLNTALGDIYTDADTYIGAFQKFAQQLRRNEDGLKDMGLATRDNAGNLRAADDVYREAIALVGQYKPGLDQTTAAQKLFGKSIDDVMKLQKLNNEVLAEAKRKNEELGLVITDQNVTAMKEYKAAMNDVGDVMAGIMKVVGDAVMPVFTELATYLASTGPYVINIFKGAMTGLLLVFRTVGAIVKSAGAVIFEFINTIMDQVGNLSDLISAVFRGDFASAAESAKRYFNRFGQAAKNVAGEIKDAFVTAKDSFSGDLDRMWGPRVAAKGAMGKGTKTMGDLKDKKEKETKDESALPGVEEKLAAAKLLYAQQNDLREMNKAQELATYQELLSAANLTEKDKVSAAKKTSEMKLGVLREARQQEIALSEEAVEAYKTQQLAVLDATRAENQFKVNMGAMTAQEMLQQDTLLEKQRYELTRAAVEQRLEILSKDPTKNVVALQKLNDELAAVEQEHATKSRALIMASQLEQRKDWQGLFDSIGSAFGNVVTGLVNRTMTLGQAVKSLFAGLLQSVASYLGQMVAKKVAAYAAEKAMQMGSVAGNAAVAGSGAAAAVAPTPFAGPALALAALAAVFAAVIGMQSSIPSARNGFDIPSGLNPLTQLHEREMVLPQEQADQVRNMTGGNGGEKIIINTAGGDFIHKDQLGMLLKKMNRSFEFK